MVKKSDKSIEGSALETVTKKIMFKKKLKKKQVFKKTRATVSIPGYKAPSVLGDPNRFFKGEVEEMKRSAYTEW